MGKPEPEAPADPLQDLYPPAFPGGEQLLVFTWEGSDLLYSRRDEIEKENAVKLRFNSRPPGAVVICSLLICSPVANCPRQC